MLTSAADIEITEVSSGRLSAALASVWGRNSASLAGTLTGPIGNTFEGFRQDALVS